MADDDVTLDEIYGEVDKRIATLKAELLAAMDAKLAELAKKIPEPKEPLRILRKRA